MPAIEQNRPGLGRCGEWRAAGLRGSATGETGNIWALFVDPDHEGKGRGVASACRDGQLAFSARAFASLAGHATSHPAQRFYEAAGWSFVRMLPDGEALYEMLAPDAAPICRRGRAQMIVSPDSRRPLPCSSTYSISLAVAVFAASGALAGVCGAARPAGCDRARLHHRCGRGHHSRCAAQPASDFLDHGFRADLTPSWVPWQSRSSGSTFCRFPMNALLVADAIGLAVFAISGRRRWRRRRNCSVFVVVLMGTEDWRRRRRSARPVVWEDSADSSSGHLCHGGHRRHCRVSASAACKSAHRCSIRRRVHSLLRPRASHPSHLISSFLSSRCLSDRFLCPTTEYSQLPFAKVYPMYIQKAEKKGPPRRRKLTRSSAG